MMRLHELYKSVNLARLGTQIYIEVTGNNAATITHETYSEGGYGINIQVEKYDNREIYGMRFKSTNLNICG